MPVGIALVVDQAYMQDVLLAFANSQLKLQITQVDWARFRDPLRGTDSTGDSGTLDQPGVISVGGNTSTGGLSSDFGPKPFGPPVGPMGFRPPPGPMGPQGQYGQYPGGGPATVSEAQLTSGLIQLQVYGVVSLYEKYVPQGETAKEPVVESKPKLDPKVADPKAKTPKADPKIADPKTPKEPAVPDPKTPKEPAVPDPKTPKMRRRIR
jgi:hypothetical protein